MKALVVDDHPLFHETLSAVLRKAFPGVAVHCESDLAGALKWARGCPDLDLVLLDLGLTDSRGLETLQRFRKQFPDVRVVVVSAEEDPASMRESIRGGAAGYIPKFAKPAGIVEALRLVKAGGTYVPPEALEKSGRGAARRTHWPAMVAKLGLTGRQAGVLRLLLQGHSNQGIAETLRITESTAKQHVQAVYASLGVSSRAEALIAAARRGITVDGD